ncbi:MAG: 2-C-methyl-D-erythritol 4-phosphate cytidylyltransferase [Gammaproteobacteria bacterium]
MTNPERDHKYWAIVPAAGSGRRMGADVPKQYLQLGGQTVLEHALDALLACTRISGIVVVVAPNDERWPAIMTRYRDQRIETATGGAERCHSVLNGLQQLGARAHDEDWVLVHDAARPCLRTTDIDVLIEALHDDTQGGLLGVPVADTLKQVDGAGRITATVERTGIWRALTPQMFRSGQLRAALQQVLANNRVVTDEAAAMELAGYHPRMVEGQGDNIKITLPADLALANFYLHLRSQS